MVTRTRERAAGLVDTLHAHGAEVVVVPMLATAVLRSPAEIVEAVTELLQRRGPRWVVFTSATAVRLVLGVTHLDTSAIAVAAVGQQTAAALLERGVAADVVAADASAAALADALVSRGVQGATMLFPTAEGAADVLERQLAHAGARVVRINVYRSEQPANAQSRLRHALQSRIDAVTLTSSSTARHLANALDGQALPENVLVACIGESTASAAREQGFANVAIASEHSAAGLAALLCERLRVTEPLP
jgi:uroporphyrinogen III methyltransferase/synthase